MKPNKIFSQRFAVCALAAWTLLVNPVTHAENPGEAPAPEPAAERPLRPQEQAAHHISLGVAPVTEAATWIGSGQEFGFRSTGLGVLFSYETRVHRLLTISVDYLRTQYKLETKKEAFLLRNSEIGIERYGVDLRSCFLGQTSYFQQICAGIRLGQEGYSTLSYYEPTELRLDRVQDFVLGLSLSYTSPITDHLIFHALGSYNHGLGWLRGGSLRAKRNSSYALRLGPSWEFTEHQALGVELEWMNRTALIEERAEARDWTSHSTDLSLRVSYQLAF